MQLTVDRGVFLKALSHGQNVVERRHTIPILGNVLLTASAQGLSLTATDMDLALIETIPATVQQPGTTTVSAHMLFDIVRKLPDGLSIELVFQPRTEQLVLTAGRARFQLSCLPAEDFPQMTQTALPCQFTMGTADLRHLLDKARFAMSSEETRYYLNGIHLHPKISADARLLRSVATDAHRLACIELVLPTGAEQMPGIIIGRKTITEVRKLLEEMPQDVCLGLSDTRIEFAFKNAVLTSRLIDGSFPEYERVIPLENNKIVTVNTKNFTAAVDRVATVINDKVRAIKLSLAQHSLTLSAESHDLGSAVEEMAVDYPHSESIDIGFNARYLLDITQQIDEEEMQIHLADGASPALIKGINNNQALYVLMPMRV